MGRAVQAGDVGAIAALAGRNPTAGAKALLELFRAKPPTLADVQALSLAAQTSERLRADQGFGLALQLSGACNRLTAEIRLEEAIAAFACGEDGRVRQIAEADPAVARTLGPLIAAVEGKRIPPMASGSSPARHAAIACCRAVSAIASRRRSAVQAAINQVPRDQRGRFFASEILATSRLLLGKGSGADVDSDAMTLARSSAVRRSERAMAALGMAVARRAPEAFLDRLSAKMGLGPDVVRDAAVYASCSEGTLEAEQARVSMLIAKLGADAFPEADRANAALYEGFAFTNSDPTRARRALDQAVALGGDMVEAARGRVLLAKARHDLSPEAWRELASASQRMQQLLDRDPDAGCFAALLAVEGATAVAKLGQGQTPKAMQMLRAAREQAVARGFLGEGLAILLDLSEAEVCFNAQPNRAHDLVESILEKAPRHHDAWHLRVNIARKVKDGASADALVFEAAKLGICPEFVDEARRIRRASPEPISLVAGTTGAGELAEELWSRLCRRAKNEDSATNPAEDRDDDVALCRAALPSPARAAFDAAHVAMLVRLGHATAAIELAARNHSEDGFDLDQACQMMAPLVVLLERRNLPDAVSRLLGSGARSDLLMRIGRMMLGSDEPSVAKDVLLRIAGRLTASDIDSLKRAVVEASRGEIPAIAIDPFELISRANRLLGPFFSLDELIGGEADPLDENDEEEDEDDGDSWPGDDGDCDDPSDEAEIAMLFSVIKGRLEGLPPAQRAEGRKAFELAARIGPTPKGVRALARVMTLVGLDMDELFGGLRGGRRRR